MAVIDYRRPNIPRSAGMVALWLTLASLSMLFLAGMMGYFFMRHRYPGPKLVLPHILVFSTLLVLLVSFTLNRALAMVQSQKIRAFMSYLHLSLGAAILFVVIQIPALATILQSHNNQLGQKLPLYGVMFFLILLHAAHVLGGICVLAYCTIRAHRQAFDHEHWLPIRQAMVYWHFLDIVWIIMFGSFLISA